MSKTLPKMIYLQTDSEGEPMEDDWTWCVDEINETDTEYIRADLHAIIEQELKSSRYQISRAIAQLGGRIDPDRFDGNDAEIEHLDDLISSVHAQLRAYEDSVND